MNRPGPVRFLPVLLSFAALGCALDRTRTNTGAVRANQAPTSSTTTAEPKPAAPKRAPVASTAEFLQFSGRDEVSTSAMAFPTGTIESSAVLLRKALPREVQLQVPFDFLMEACNLTEGGLGNVVVTDTLPAEFRVADANVRYEVDEGGLVHWRLGTFEPGQCKVVRIRGVANQVGTLSTCSKVSYSAGFCSTFTVTQGALDISCILPRTVMVCDTIPVTLTVANRGNGTARGVTLTCELPEGIVTGDDNSSFAAEIGTIEAGDSREISVELKTNRAAQYTIIASCQSVNGLRDEVSCEAILSVQPKLEISVAGRPKQILGRPVTFTATVTSSGNGPAEGVVVESPVPAGSTLLRASEDGQPVGQKTVWNLGSLESGESRELTATYSIETASSVENVFTARGECATEATASAQTEVEGVAALLLDVVDVSDPVVVGENATYFIRVTNQGSASATGARIDCMLEESMEYLSSTGPTDGTYQDGRVRFASVASLDPKDSVEWKIVIRAKAEGDARFKASLTSDQSSRPIEESEATNFYR